MYAFFKIHKNSKGAPGILLFSIKKSTYKVEENVAVEIFSCDQNSYERVLNLDGAAEESERSYRAF